MAIPGLGLLLAVGLPMLPAGWSQAPTALDPFNSTTPSPDPDSSGGLSSEAVVAIAVVFSILGVILLAVGLFLLMRKLREKRQTEGTYRPSSEEQVGARAPPPPTSSCPRRSGSSERRGVGHRLPPPPRTALAHPGPQQPPWRHASL